MIQVYSVLAPVIVTCDELTAPANGDVNQPGNSVGTVARYTCKDGFELIGNKTRTCQEDGEWSGTDPTCKCEHILLLADKIVEAAIHCVKGDVFDFFHYC